MIDSRGISHEVSEAEVDPEERKVDEVVIGRV